MKDKHRIWFDHELVGEFDATHDVRVVSEPERDPLPDTLVVYHHGHEVRRYRKPEWSAHALPGDDGACAGHPQHGEECRRCTGR